MKSTRIGILGSAVLIAALVLPEAGAAQTPSAPTSPPVFVTVAQTDTPHVILAAAAGSYVTVVRVSDDKKVHIVYPVSPTAQSPFPAGPGWFSLPLNVPRYSMGGVFAVASTVPFNYARITKGNRWNDDALILTASRDPQHAANRVFGMITPASATVSFDQTVYLGTETAKKPYLVYDAINLYLPDVWQFASDQCSMVLNRYECGGTRESRGSPYLGCMQIGSTPAYSPFCGTVHDLFQALQLSLPPRLVTPSTSIGYHYCNGEVCSLFSDSHNGVRQGQPSADYSHPMPAPALTPPSPTPLPVPTGTTPAIPPSSL